MTGLPIDLVCVDHRSSRDWEINNSGQRVIKVLNARMLGEALHNGTNEFGKEIRRVIFDMSSDPASFLQFLGELPVDFRGDVLAIQRDGRSFLSAPAARGDGRVLYTLTAADLDFYLAASYSVRSVDPIVVDTNFYKIHAA